MKSKGNGKKVQKKVSIESKERQNTHTKGTTKKAKRGGDYRQLVFRADRIGTDRIGSDRIGSQLSVSQLRAKSTSIGKKKVLLNLLSRNVKVANQTHVAKIHRHRKALMMGIPSHAKKEAKYLPSASRKEKVFKKRTEQYSAACYCPTAIVFLC